MMLRSHTIKQSDSPGLLRNGEIVGIAKFPATLSKAFKPQLTDKIFKF